MFRYLGLVLLMGGVCALAEENPRVHDTFPNVRRAETRAEQKPSIGILSGLSTTENHSGAANLGVEVGYQPVIPFSAAIEASVYSADGRDGSSGLTRTKLLAKALYNFGGDIPFIKYSFAGLAAGPVWDNMQNRTALNLGIAPTIGFDIPLGNAAPQFSLGANANYLFVTGGNPNVFALNGVAKYWF